MGLIQSIAGRAVAGALSLTLNGVSSSNVLVFLYWTTDSSAPTGLTGVTTVANAPAIFNSSGVNALARIYYNAAPSAGTNVAAVSLGGAAGGGVLLEWSGMLASPLDVAPAASNVTNGGTAGSNSIASGTLAQASEVLFAILFENTSGAGTASSGLNNPPSGWSDLDSATDSSADFIYDIVYQVVNSTAGATASWTWTDTTTIISQATLAGFKITAPSLPPGSIYT